MRIVIQRAKEARVSLVEGGLCRDEGCRLERRPTHTPTETQGETERSQKETITGAIGKGLVILLGVCEEDTEEDVEWLVRKVAALRIFDDEAGVMNRSVMDVGGECLVVSQFTLFASYKKGNRPSWLRAARHEISVPLYELFCRRLGETIGKPVQTGVFGANMRVSLVNDGPVTICMDTKNKE
jgi:D-tyrosyl-tRNA(Tyr) deacylase